MEREMGSSPRVDVNGRLGRILARNASDLTIKVEFDDGKVEWVHMDHVEIVREQAAADEPLPRELGS